METVHGSWLLIGALRIAYKRGILRFAREPFGSGVVCWIGDNWFYFSDEAEDYDNAAEYLQSVGISFALERVYDTLEGAGGMNDWNQDEHDYYIAVLKESGCYTPLG